MKRGWNNYVGSTTKYIISNINMETNRLYNDESKNGIIPPLNFYVGPQDSENAIANADPRRCSLQPNAMQSGIVVSSTCRQ